MQLRRTAALVCLPRSRVWWEGSRLIRRQHLRLPQLLPSGLREPARNGGLPSLEAGTDNSGTLGRNSKHAGTLPRRAKGNALANLREITGETRPRRTEINSRDGNSTRLVVAAREAVKLTAGLEMPKRLQMPRSLGSGCFPPQDIEIVVIGTNFEIANWTDHNSEVNGTSCLTETSAFFTERQNGVHERWSGK
jgi:hypothetical protein